MYEITLTPAAAAGMFFSHRNHEVKGAADTRAALDAERWFLDEDDPLIKSDVIDVEKTPDNPAGKGTVTGASFKEDRVVRLEKHVRDWLKKAHDSVVDGGKVFGFARGQASLLMSSEASAALEKAVEVRVEKAPPATATPTLVGKGKKTAAG